MVIFKEEEYVNSVVEVTKVSDRYMSLKLEVEGVLSVCMAQKMDVNRKRERGIMELHGQVSRTEF